MDRHAEGGIPALDAGGLAGAMVCFRDLLRRHQAVINRLNVYPVPDGDTGTNMLLTVEAVVAEISGLPEPPGLPGVCGAIAHGSLMGARGNSGVILCQVLRAMARTFERSASGELGAATVASGIAAGASAARQAVLRPVEGTMLSVADAAADAAGRGLGLVEVLDLARRAAVEALWRTPEQLAVLAASGVVDAGGAGLVLLFDALAAGVTGEVRGGELELPPEVGELVRSTGSAPKERSGDEAGRGAPSGQRFEVMFLLDAPDEAIPPLKQVWDGIGDSIVVVGGEGTWSCHIHTDDAGAALDAALDAGRPRNIRVTDLAEQVEEELWVRQAGRGAAEPAPPGPPPATSVVAVATGDGVSRIFRSLGVEVVVAGGQTMNPSTADILGALDQARGEEVVVLPNNSNIVPVAEQAAAVTAKKVRVVPTRGIQEGFAALLEYDPQASVDENAEAMARSASRIVAGEVTRAVRAGEAPCGRIEAGDYLGLSRQGIESVAPTLAQATCDLLARLVRPGQEIVTLIEGQGATTADSRIVAEWLRAEHPELSLERHAGGQPLYPFLVSIE